MSKPVKITLPCYMSYGRWEDVQAEIVDVAPHLPFLTFAVHDSLGCLRYGYQVSNIETGTCIVRGQRTKGRCIREAIIFLSCKTADDAEKAMAKAMRNIKEKL